MGIEDVINSNLEDLQISLSGLDIHLARFPNDKEAEDLRQIINGQINLLKKILSDGTA